MKIILILELLFLDFTPLIQMAMVQSTHLKLIVILIAVSLFITFFEKRFSNYFFLFSESTKVFHDQGWNIEIDRCNSQDCYSLNITYNNTMDEIKALISGSKSCKQMIKVYTT